jgi:hypothetical protein
MKNILFSKHPERIEIDAGKTVCVYHRQYSKILPKIPNGEYIEFGKLCDTFQTHNYFEGKDVVVFVGANKLFSSSTRFHPVFDVLQYGLEGMQRYAVDTSPYIGPLWRVFPQFSLAGISFGEYTYSYLLESHYNSFIEGMRPDNPLTLDNIRAYARGHVSIDYERYFSETVVEIIPMHEDVHEKYRTLKARLFDEEIHATKIIKRLSDFAKVSCPKRSIPAEHKIFETPDAVRIVRTDLKVDEYLAGKLFDKIREVNAVCEAMQP